MVRLNFKTLYNIFFETKNFHNLNLYEYHNENDLIEGLKKQKNSVIISRAQISNQSVNQKQIIVIAIVFITPTILCVIESKEEICHL